MALTAGGTLTAYQLEIPPFQGLEPGLVRIRSGIAVDYTDIDGKPWNCDTFLEFRDVSQAEVDRVKAHVQAQDWSDLGPSAYREAVRTSPSRAAASVRVKPSPCSGARISRSAGRSWDIAARTAE